MPVSGLCAVPARHDTLQDNRRRSSKAEATRPMMSAPENLLDWFYPSKLGKTCSGDSDRSHLSMLAGVLQKVRCMLTLISIAPIVAVAVR